MKTYYSFIILFLITFNFISCNTDNFFIDETYENSKVEIINKINNFCPNQSDIAATYFNFLKQMHESNCYKESTGHIRIDSALWESETYLNNKYGFSLDSTCYKYSENTIEVSFDIINYNGAIPIIDKRDLDEFVSMREAEFSDENCDLDHIYYWCCLFDAFDIRDSKVYTSMSIVYLTDYIGVYPPGWDPDNFPNPTCMYAVKPGYCDYTLWKGANNEYEWRYEIHNGGSYKSDGYIMIYYGHFSKGPKDYGVNGRLWYEDYTTNDLIILNTSGDDVLNTYLQSTKDLIDEGNPMGNYNIFLGNINIWKSVVNVPGTDVHIGHGVTWYLFKKTPVGLPG